MNEWGEVDRPVGSSDDGVRPRDPDASPWGQQASRDERLALSRSGYASLTADRRVRCTAGTPACGDAHCANYSDRCSNHHFRHCAQFVYQIYSVFKIFEIAVCFAQFGFYEIS